MMYACFDGKGDDVEAGHRAGVKKRCEEVKIEDKNRWLSQMAMIMRGEIIIKRLIQTACSLFIFISTGYSQPISLHPENNHYFLYKGKPTVLVTCSEHYGAVINLDFDFELYLDTLKRCGFNNTRLFLGDYVEEPQAFCIVNNTLSPDPNRFICPWARSAEPKYILGGNKFDLDTWDKNYFQRLHKYISTARDHDIIVEIMLFFTGLSWEYSPLYTDNNINNTSRITNVEYLTLDNGNILERQEAYCRKIITELNQYDNIIYNIAMESWFNNHDRPGFVTQPSDQTKAWIQRATEWIIDEEHNLAKKHILSVDFCNEGTVIEEKHLSTYFKHISVFNHHYDKNAESLRLNYHRVNKAFAFNETGFMHPTSSEYRMQGWKYLFSGGALYNNLDYTFQVGHEDGTGRTDFSCEWYSGCVNPQIRPQLKALLDFMNSLDFIHMKPSRGVLSVYFGDEDVYALVRQGHQYALYFTGGSRPKVMLSLPDGKYKATWLNPADLKVLSSQEFTTSRHSHNFAGPEYSEDIVLKIDRAESGHN